MKPSILLETCPTNAHIKTSGNDITTTFRDHDSISDCICEGDNDTRRVPEDGWTIHPGTNTLPDFGGNPVEGQACCDLPAMVRI